MFLVSSPELVITSCQNGVIGSFPAPNARTTEILEDWMKQIEKSLGSAEHVAPWALNMVTHRTYSRFDEEMELVKKYKPPIVITALGSPARVVEAVHEYGGLVFADVNSVEFAKKAAETGVDGLVLVSSGAGGHTGSMNGFSFVEAVRKFWDGIIILAGGISTGGGVLATQALGADFAYMGTSFISASESMAVQEYKEMVVASEFEDILMTDAFTGVDANMLKPSMVRAGLDPKNLGAKKTIDFSNPQGDTKAWKDIWAAGHGINAVTKVQSAKTIIEILMKEYKQAQHHFAQQQLWNIKEEVR